MSDLRVLQCAERLSDGRCRQFWSLEWMRSSLQACKVPPTLETKRHTFDTNSLKACLSPQKCEPVILSSDRWVNSPFLPPIHAAATISSQRRQQLALSRGRFSATATKGGLIRLLIFHVLCLLFIELSLVSASPAASEVRRRV